MQLFSTNSTMFLKGKKNPQKVEKKNLKSCSEKTQIHFFPYCPELPKRPKQKYLCSKIDFGKKVFPQV